MPSAAIKNPFSPEQYLALERASPDKHEYFDGHISAMAGMSRIHVLIVGNLNREISTQLKDRPCEVYASDMRVRINPTGLYTYPDLVALCGKPEFLDTEVDTLLNPTLIIEVLSPSTEAYDRGGKFEHYRRLDSLLEYVLVAQDDVRVEVHSRQGDAFVLTKDWRQLDDSLRLESIGCEVPLREIYAKVRGI